VNDKIYAIVDRTIEYTRELLETSQIDWATARAGLDRIHDSLAGEAPGHPTLDRLQDFIAEQDRIYRPR
jgi:hypothetical protein